MYCNDHACTNKSMLIHGPTRGDWLHGCGDPQECLLMQAGLDSMTQALEGNMFSRDMLW